MAGPWRAAGVAAGLSIDWPEDHYVERRDFVKFLVLTSLAFASASCGSPRRTGFARGARPAAGALRRSRGPARAPSCSTIPVSTTLPSSSGSPNRIRRLQPEVHAPVVRGDSQSRPGHPPLPVPRGRLRLATGRISRGRRRVRCRASRSKFAAATFMPRASRAACDGY